MGGPPAPDPGNPYIFGIAWQPCPAYPVFHNSTWASCRPPQDNHPSRAFSDTVEWSVKTFFYLQKVNSACREWPGRFPSGSREQGLSILQKGHFKEKNSETRVTSNPVPRSYVVARAWIKPGAGTLRFPWFQILFGTIKKSNKKLTKLNWQWKH